MIVKLKTDNYADCWGEMDDSQKAVAEAVTFMQIDPITKRNVFSERTANWNQVQFRKWLFMELHHLIQRHNYPRRIQLR